MIATELPDAPRASTAGKTATAGASALPFPAPVDSPPDWPRTIGVAIPIPEPFLAELGAYRERFGDPLAHAIVAHITLVPPSQVADPQEMEAVAHHLERVASRIAPFRVVLAGAGTFRPVSPVVFVPIGAGEEQVRAVEEQVRCGPLERKLNFPYHPHVTVAHDVAPEWLDEAENTMADYRAEFEVSSLGLFEHGQGGVWRQIREFALTG